LQVYSIKKDMVTSACINFHLEHRLIGFSILEPHPPHFLNRVDVYTQFSTFSYEDISEMSPHETNCIKERTEQHIVTLWIKNKERTVMVLTVQNGQVIIIKKEQSLQLIQELHSIVTSNNLDIVSFSDFSYLNRFLNCCHR
jgi:hypothetical protein